MKGAPGRPTERGCALVTGASRGIGAAIAHGLAADGWAVAVNHRTAREAAEQVVSSIRAAGGEAVALAADVCAPDAADVLCAGAEEALRRPVLLLVNNAGAPADRLLTNIDDESWEATIDLNLSAAFRLTRRALAPMLRERFGRVVNIAAAAALRANAGQSSYSAAKAGLIGLTRTLAVEVAGQGVTVNAVAPGLIRTDATEEMVATLVRRVPARRAGTAEEVAACVRFLASEGAGYVTGSVLTVDGGFSA